MASRPELSAELRDLLDLTVRSHLGPERLDHDLVLHLCEEAVDFGCTYAPDGVGLRARRSALLLLDLACPTISPYLRRELAVACELAAIGAAVRDQ